jgi:hypothetical protein
MSCRPGVSRAGPSTAGHRHPDAGNALVEFVALGVLLLIPVVYLVLALGRIQAASFAVDGAARDAARAFVTAGDEASGRARALAAVRLRLLDQGFDVDPGQATALRCRRLPCLSPQAKVDVTVSVDVVLPGVPGVVDRFIASHVTVRATHMAVVDAFCPVPAP